MVRTLDLQLTVMSSNPCNVAIFRLFKMAAAAILDFENFTFLTVGTVTCAKLQNEIVRGYDFTGGRMFHFPTDF